MAESVIRRLVVSLGVDADTKAVAHFDDAMGRVKSTVQRTIAVTAAAATGAVTLGGALATAAYQASDTAKNMDEQAEAVGLNVERYQELTAVAERFGMEGRDIQDLLSVLSDRADDAQRGTKSFVEAFGLLNIEAEELEGLNPQEILFKTAEGIRQLESDAKRLAAAERLLGGELGQKFMPMLQMGRDELKRFTNRVDDLGAIMEEDTIDSAKAWRGELFFLRKAWDGIVQTIGTAAIPFLKQLTDATLDWVASNQELLEQRINLMVREAVDIVKIFLRDVRNTALAVDDLANKLGGWKTVLTSIDDVLKGIGFGLIASQVWSLAAAAGSALAGLASLGGLSTGGGLLATLMSSGFGATLSAIGSGLATIAGAIPHVAALIAAFTGLFFAIQDVWGYFQGQESLTGKLVEWVQTSDTMQSSLEALSSLFAEIKGLFFDLMDVGRALWPMLQAQAMNFFSKLKWAFKTVWNIAQPVFILIAQSIENTISMIRILANILTGDFGKAFEIFKAMWWDTVKSIWLALKEAVLGIKRIFFDTLQMLAEHAESWLNALGFDVDFTGSSGGTDSGDGAAPGNGPSGGSAISRAPGGSAPSSSRMSSMPASGGGDTVIQGDEVEMNITQREGESSEDFAERVNEKREERRRERLKKARDNMRSGSER